MMVLVRLPVVHDSSRRGQHHPSKPVTVSARALRTNVRTLPHWRPQTRAQCEDAPRPCPYVGCRFHLYLDVSKRGSIKLNFPHLEPEELEHSCALDVAESGGATLEQVGYLLNVVRERVRQLEDMAFRKLREAARKLR